MVCESLMEGNQLELETYLMGEPSTIVVNPLNQVLTKSGSMQMDRMN